VQSVDFVVTGQGSEGFLKVDGVDQPFLKWFSEDGRKIVVTLLGIRYVFREYEALVVWARDKVRVRTLDALANMPIRNSNGSAYR